MTPDDFVATLQDRVRAAAEAKRPLRIHGGRTKDFYGAITPAEPLDMRPYSGIVAYEPRELVLTVRAGTPLREVEAALAAERQMLPFEPPHFAGDGSAATIGGVVATGLSGPRRPYAGAVRDYVLGTRIVNGKGEDLSFGGRVIKNVAGYDVSRLMAGALGTLGVLLDVSFKVLPLPPAEATLAFELDEESATRQANRWAGQPIPLSATAWQDGVLRVRLSGAEPAVRAARARIGGEPVEQGPAYWADLREQRLPFFRAGAPLWRISVPQTTAPIALQAPQLVEWGGGLRWVAGAMSAAELRRKVESLGGHVTLFRAADAATDVFHPLAAPLWKIHQRLKRAFDPAGIFNPGRMYPF